MVAAFSKKSHEEPTWLELEHAIKRNFGGLDHTDPVKIFAAKMQNVNKRKAVRAPFILLQKYMILHSKINV